MDGGAGEEQWRYLEVSRIIWRRGVIVKTGSVLLEQLALLRDLRFFHRQSGEALKAVARSRRSRH